MTSILIIRRLQKQKESRSSPLVNCYQERARIRPYQSTETEMKVYGLKIAMKSARLRYISSRYVHVNTTLFKK